MKAFSIEDDAPEVYAGAEEAALESQWRADRQNQGNALARKETEEHFEKIYTDQSYFDEIAKDERIAEAEKHALKPDEVRYGAANRSYLSFLTGRELSGIEYESVRGAYAKKEFGKQAVTDKEFYTLVQGQHQARQQRRAAATELYTGAVKQTLEDELDGTSTSTVEMFQKWKEKNRELVSAEDELQFFTSGRRIVQQARSDIEKFKAPAARAWQTLTKFTQGEASEADLQHLGGELAAIPREDRKTLLRYAVIASQASGDDDLSSLEQLAKNLGESISRGFSFLEGPSLTGKDANQRYEYIPLATIERQSRVRLNQLEREKDTPEKEMEKQALARTLEMAQVVRELKEVARAGVDPIKPIFPEGGFFSAGTIERGFYGTANSLGYMTAVGMPGVGPLLGVIAMQGQEYDKMRLENPDMNPGAASAASLVSATAQTAIEMLQIQTLFGRLPIFSTLLKDIPRGITRTAAGIGLGVSAENIEEGVQDAISDFLPLVMSALRDDMPDKDPAKVFGDYFKVRGEVFWSVLPLGLVAGGFASLTDYKAEGQDLLNEKSLSYFGFNSKQRAAILSSRDPETEIAIQAPLRTATGIKQGIKAVEADFAAAGELQKNPAMPTLENSILPDGIQEWRVVRNAPEGATKGISYLTPAEMEGKMVSVEITNPQTGESQYAVVAAEDGQAMASRSIDSYTKLIDCLLK